MRIDKWLKVSRLTKRREVAKELCDDGDVLLNNKVAKASSEVCTGDILTLTMGRHKITAKILAAKPYAKKDEAKEMYEILSDEVRENLA
ncbi:MAG: RNA-binding S4 domain-containing protein [Mollicutes bacterium]|nr:RNA-binding S4 domain-containing protein [Mollicutes bacterium]